MRGLTDANNSTSELPSISPALKRSAVTCAKQGKYVHYGHFNSSSTTGSPPPSLGQNFSGLSQSKFDLHIRSIIR